MSHNNFMTIASSIDGLLNYLANEKKSSPLTIRNYRHYLNRFLSFCRQSSPPLLTIDQISPMRLQQYEQFLMEFVDKDSIPLKRITKQYHLIALRTWLRYLKTMGAIDMSYTSVQLTPVVRDKPLIAKESTIQQLIVSISVASRQGIRNRAILELLVSTGIKVSELVRLDRNEILLASRQMVVSSARGEYRRIGFSERTGLWLGKYMVTREDTFPALFIRYAGRKEAVNQMHEGQRLTARSVQRMMRNYGKKVGLAKTPTPEGLRHAFGERMRKNSQS